MANDGLLLVSRVKLRGTAVQKRHGGREQLFVVQFGNIGPEINGGVGGDRRLAAEPMNPAAGRRTILRAAKPAWVPHRELAIHRAGIHIVAQPEELLRVRA